MTFEGKVSMWWGALIAVLNGVEIASAIYAGLSATVGVGILMLVALDLILIPTLFNNRVTVTKKEIVIQFGFLRKEFAPKDITRIKKVKGISASFAASADRVGIELRGRNAVFVSLKDNDAFVKELLRINKRIQYMI